MTRIVLPLIALAPATALGMAASPVAAAEIQLAANGPVVELTVTQLVSADPDIANLSAGVSTIAPTAVEALRLNSVEMNRVIPQIEALGILPADIQTSGITINPEYAYDQADGQQRFVGYRAINRVQVTLRRIDSTGEVLDALVAAGANDVSGVQWSLDDPLAAQEQARQAAFATARARAEGYARLAGMNGVRLLEVNETVANGVQPSYDFQELLVAARLEAAPVRPGQIQTGVTITVKYEMTQ